MDENTTNPGVGGDDNAADTPATDAPAEGDTGGAPATDAPAEGTDSAPAADAPAEGDAAPAEGAGTAPAADASACTGQPDCAHCKQAAGSSM